MISLENIADLRRIAARLDELRRSKTVDQDQRDSLRHASTILKIVVEEALLDATGF